MRNWKFTLLAGTMLAVAAQPAYAQSGAAEPQASDESGGLVDIVVTARRSEEKLQDVPVAVSVLTPAMLETKGTFNPVDIARSAPGLNVTGSLSNRDNLTFTIRGQGFSFGTTFPAVITYFNEIPVNRLTQGTFFDLANIQVLRGPQGVTFGRVTDGGNIMVAAQAPKEDFGGYVTAKYGSYNQRTLNGAINVPVVEDKVLLRGAFEIARRDGFTKNLLGPARDDVRYEGYRVGLTVRPFDGLESTTTVNYLTTDTNGTGAIFSNFNPAASGLLPGVGRFSFLFAGGYGIDGNGSVVPLQTIGQAGFTPFTAANYAANLQAQLTAQKARGIRTVSLADPSFSSRKNLYVVNSTALELSDNVELTNIFGFVREKEDGPANFAGSNGAAVLTCQTACFGNNSGVIFINRKQFSEELRLSGKSFGNRLTWSLGGYLDEQKPNGPSENSTINVAILNRVGILDNTTKSRAVYGSFEYEITDNFKVNGGLRYTKDTIHSEQNTFLSPLDGPAPRQALFNFLTGPFGGSLPAAVANQVVAGTFAPIPHGQCVTYGAGSVLYASGAGPCIVRDAKFNSTTWQAGASYQTDGGQLFYAKVSKGYRPGGVNGTAPPGADPAYAPETDVSIELGIKADFRFNGVFLRTNLAAFTDRYKDIQKNVVLPGAVPVSLVQNVNNGRIKGIEFEATLIPVEGLMLGANFAYTDAKFDRVDTSGNVSSTGAPADPCNPTHNFTVGFCSANRFNSVPKYQLNLNAEYRLPLDESIGQISIGGSMFHQSSVALSDTSRLNPETVEGGHTSIDAQINWRNVAGKPIDLSFFVTNLTKEAYRISASSLLQNSSLGISADVYSPPRMFGVSAKFRFGSDAN